jgi:hypothetical protein
MIRKILFALLLAPVFFTACKKNESTPNEFIINGIRDVNFGTTGSNVLPVTVSVSSGVQERVTLTVTNLPSGITATIDPNSGTPSFGSTITFNQTGGATAGTYAIHVVGTSSSYTKSYDLNLTVPSLNGWLVDGTSYRLFNLSTNSIAGYADLNALSYDNGGAYLDASIMGAFPTADGSYTYHLYTSSDVNKNMSVAFSPNTSSAYYQNSGSDMHDAVLKVSGGKYSLSFPTTEFVNSATGAKKMVTADMHEL